MPSEWNDRHKLHPLTPALHDEPFADRSHLELVRCWRCLFGSKDHNACSFKERGRAVIRCAGQVPLSGQATLHSTLSSARRPVSLDQTTFPGCQGALVAINIDSGAACWQGMSGTCITVLSCCSSPHKPLASANPMPASVLQRPISGCTAKTHGACQATQTFWKENSWSKRLQSPLQMYEWVQYELVAACLLRGIL